MSSLHQLVSILSKEEKLLLGRMLPALAPKSFETLEFLLNEYEKQHEPDEEKIKQKLTKKKLGSNFPRSRKQLHDAVLDTLVSYHQEAMAEAKVSKLIQQFAVLFDKEQYHDACKLLDAALQLSNEAELLVQKQQILLLFSQNFAMLQLANKGYERKYYTTELAKVAEQITDLLQSRILLDEMYDFVANRTHSRDKDQTKQMQAFVAHPFFKDANKCKSFLSKHHYYHSLFWAHTVLRESKKRLKIGREWVAFVDAYANKEHKAKNIYIAYLKTFETLSEHELWQEFKVLLDKFMALTFDSGYYHNRQKETYFRMALTLNVNTGKEKEARIIIDDCHQYYTNEKLKPQFVPETFILIVKASFLMKDYDKTVKICNDFFNIEKQHSRQDMRASIRIFWLFSQFEIGNAEIVETLIRQTERYMKEENLLFEYEQRLIKFLKQMMRSKSKRELKQTCSQALAELEQSSKYQENINFHLHEIMPEYFKGKAS